MALIIRIRMTFQPNLVCKPNTEMKIWFLTLTNWANSKILAYRQNLQLYSPSAGECECSMGGTHGAIRDAVGIGQARIYYQYWLLSSLSNNRNCWDLKSYTSMILLNTVYTSIPLSLCYLLQFGDRQLAQNDRLKSPSCHKLFFLFSAVR